MKTIYKYNLSLPGSKAMPLGSTIVKVGIQNGQCCIWALVDTNAPIEERRFVIVGTGHELDDNMVYVGTVFEEPFVWHVMELKKNEMENC
jgi:hypothetical protein